MINEIVVDLDDGASDIILTIHWAGGVHTELRMPHRKRGQTTWQTPKDVVDAVRSLARVCGNELIAGVLNKNGYRTFTGNRWTQARVGSLQWRHEIPGNTAARRAAHGWMTLKDAAAHLGIAPLTLRRAAERGQIPADHPLPKGPWIFTGEALSNANAQELCTAAKRARKGEKPVSGQRPMGTCRRNATPSCPPRIARQSCSSAHSGHRDRLCCRTSPLGGHDRSEATF